MSLNDPAPQSGGRSGRRTLILLAIVIPVITAAVALPRLMRAEPEPEQADTAVVPDTAAPIEAAIVEPPEVTEVESAPEPTGPQPSEKGDLALGVELAWESFATGTVIDATISLHNLSLTTMHVPAASEPQPTLNVIVFDEAGAEVRRIAEHVDEPMPRRTTRLEAGDRIEFTLAVIADGEDPLVPGTYHMRAEYGSDPRWRRTGAPMWDAARGAVHSDVITFAITAAK